MRRRSEPSIRRQFFGQLLWLLLVVGASYLFFHFEVYRLIGEWYASQVELGPRASVRPTTSP